MKFHTKVSLFIVGTLLSLISLTNAACEQPKCFDCNLCEKDCTNVKQNCDTDCIVQVRQFLCKMENENCKKSQGCDVPPVDVIVYPAKDYNESKPEWKGQTISARKNCCYKLSGIYDNTLSGLKNNGACVKLYDTSDCTGTVSVTVDASTSAECLSWIDCAARLTAGGTAFNDKASSFELC